MPTQTIKPPYQYFGGKQRIASKIVAQLPRHQHYVEPFAGSLAVLLSKAPAPHETVNDLDSDIVTFWRVLRDQPEELIRLCALTPHSREEHQSCADREVPDLELARRVWVRLTQGYGGQTKSTGWRHYVRPVGQFGVPKYMGAYVDRMIAAAERIRGVSIECKRASAIIAQYGGNKATLLYVDPPYPKSTRDTTARYRFDYMTEEHHVQLAEMLNNCAAAVVLSSYPSPMYIRLYRDWRYVTLDAYTSQGGYGDVRTECLWVKD